MSGPIPARQPSITSPPPTPSPRRPSAMLGGAGGAVGSSAEQRRARREQFRSFYGLKGGPPGAGDEGDGSQSLSSGGGPSKSSGQTGGDRLNIDSPAFDAAAYYEDLIKKSSLAELMQAAAGMSADINNLQSSRHSLVYNHHHQLFAAGDTISHLNSRTPQLLSIMTSLQDSFSSISQLADSVAMPSDPSASEEKDRDDRALEDGLERVRLMILAEEDAGAIRRAWDGLKRDDIADEGLQQKMEELRRTVDSLATTTPAEGEPPSIEA